MKTLLILALIFSAVPAFAKAPSFRVACTGLSDDGSTITEATSSDDGTQLQVSMYPSRSVPNRENTREYDVTETSAMFPITSLKAVKDERPVDGVLTEVYLAISTEFSSAGRKNPGTLTYTSTYFDRRLGKEVTTSDKHKVSCVVGSAL